MVCHHGTSVDTHVPYCPAARFCAYWGLCSVQLSQERPTAYHASSGHMHGVLGDDCFPRMHLEQWGDVVWETGWHGSVLVLPAGDDPALRLRRRPAPDLRRSSTACGGGGAALEGAASGVFGASGDATGRDQRVVDGRALPARGMGAPRPPHENRCVSRRC
jgi:hypothetical protein